ncbi:hypothetical protein FRC06_005968 [Ceratobasidium sp. 370]|nr:hypothetical protein FRC06_005968 [Ceratobasidium sp. 370]
MAKRVCPCCSKWCSEHTVYQHLRNYEKNFELPSSDSDLADDDADSDSEPVDGGKVLGDVKMEPGLGQNEEPAHIPGNMDIDTPTNTGPNQVYVPFLGQLYRILRNPPVTINDWDDPADSDSSEADDNSTDQESVSSDQDPVYNE